jgi:hypothetical protein
MAGERWALRVAGHPKPIATGPLPKVAAQAADLVRRHPSYSVSLQMRDSQFEGRFRIRKGEREWMVAYDHPASVRPLSDGADASVRHQQTRIIQILDSL